MTTLKKSAPVILSLLMFTWICTAPGFAQRKTLQISFPDINWSEGWAVGMKAGTLGVGFEGIKSVNKNWNARVGFSYLPFPVNRLISQGNLNLDLRSKIRLGGINLQGDFYLSQWYYFTGGFVINLSRVLMDITLNDEIRFGDISIRPEDIGTLDIKALPGWPISPYLGVGFGNPLPAGKKFWFNVELGAAYHGKPRFRLDAKGMIEPTANENNEKALKESFKGFRIFPVFSVQANYLIR